MHEDVYQDASSKLEVLCRLSPPLRDTFKTRHTIMTITAHLQPDT